jgi:hypothetical protein
MMIRFAILPLLLALNFSMCKKQQAVTDKPQPAGSAAPGTAAATAAPVVAATPKIKKPVVDQTARPLFFVTIGWSTRSGTRARRLRQLRLKRR